MMETYNRNDSDKGYSKRNSNSVSFTPSSSKNNTQTIENAQILQGDGSLGAFGCGVFKAFAKRNAKINIVAGTSIGGVNAAIIAGSKYEDQAEQLLEQFWLKLCGSFVNLEKGRSAIYSATYVTHKVL